MDTEGSCFRCVRIVWLCYVKNIFGVWLCSSKKCKKLKARVLPLLPKYLPHSFPLSPPLLPLLCLNLSLEFLYTLPSALFLSLPVSSFEQDHAQDCHQSLVCGVHIDSKSRPCQGSESRRRRKRFHPDHVSCALRKRNVRKRRQYWQKHGLRRQTNQVLFSLFHRVSSMFVLLCMD